MPNSEPIRMRQCEVCGDDLLLNEHKIPMRKGWRHSSCSPEDERSLERTRDLLALARRLRDRLDRHEWAATSGRTDEPVCPDCDWAMLDENGHADDCPLAADLAEAERVLGPSGGGGGSREAGPQIVVPLLPVDEEAERYLDRLMATRVRNGRKMVDPAPMLALLRRCRDYVANAGVTAEEQGRLIADLEAALGGEGE